MTKSLRVFAIVLATLSAPTAALAGGGKGMTWTKNTGHYDTVGVDIVGCDGLCNAYNGDTVCTAALPVLCLNNTRKAQTPAPAGIPIDVNRGWSGGHIASTPPIPGTMLTSATAGDAICVAFFGPGWKMGEFHDGNGGWNWYAYGNLRTDLRYWTRISDTSGNCWN